MLPPDGALIARVVASGDQRAFAVLVRRHQSGVRGLLRRLCAGDEATADDLAQEVFMRAYAKLGSFRSEAKLSSWLYRIAYNAFLADRRRKRPELSSLDAAEEAPAPEAPSAIARHDVIRAFEVLRDEERAALSLTYGQEMTHEEAAEILQIPVGTLKSHVLRGKDKLRRRLAAWKGEVRA